MCVNFRIFPDEPNGTVAKGSEGRNATRFDRRQGVLGTWLRGTLADDDDLGAETIIEANGIGRPTAMMRGKEDVEGWPGIVEKGVQSFTFEVSCQEHGMA